MDEKKEPYGSVKYADPGYQKDKVKRYPLDSEAHCRAAWSYINMPKNAAKYTSEQVKAIKGRIKAAAKKYGIEISDEKSDRMTDVSEVETVTPSGPLEFRNAVGVTDVNFEQRIVTLIAVPYESPAKIAFKGELWSEIFERDAFSGAQKSPNRIRANRDHDRSRTMGKVVRFDRTCEEGLATEIRIAQTPLGDETLALAAEDMLSASIGFKAAPQDMKLDRHTMTRRIHRAFLDHVSFVEDPAYEGARILAVRSNGDEPEPQEPPETSSKTPLLDQWSDDEMLRWAAARLNKLADSS